MAVFTSAYKQLAHGALNWDTQLRTDMQSLEDQLNQQVWTPGFGGSAATIGNGGTSNGYWTKLGRHVSYNGRLAFGSGASWGTGTPVVTGLNVGGGMDVTITAGTGMWSRAAGGQPIPVMLWPNDVSSMAIFIVANQASAYPWSAPALGQSDQLIFHVESVLA